VAAVNIPDVRVGDDVQVGTKEGTIGQTLPNVAAKVVDPETGRPLPPGESGLLLIKGPNVMLGYLHQPEKTAEAVQDGWYRTGDIAHIDEDGFITITDRLSRFSKIGGEMVPHLRIEEAIHEAAGVHGGERLCVVTSVPDDRKGERLAVLHTELPISLDELLERLQATDLPKLWIPRKEMFRQVDEIPILGSGKLALSEVRDMASSIWGDDSADND
jgi:acyl-[acyl-carrier-protein]-phospholipid O-acyltransferase / long-chain-fatty-acid--[acyl-carrier-protein] ligase